MKCQTCREKDVELLTRWERIRGWLFYRINYVLFPDDLNDLISQRYTQGYSDGNIDGFKWGQFKKEHKIPELTYEESN